nr:hypothetical protein [Tanacetum cinerariifolium]
MLVQVYVDDIILGSTKKSWCDEFEALMKRRFQISSMGELTFFLGLQVKQKEDEIFISQDKYVVEILKKFDFMSVKTASTPLETKKHLVKDAEAADVMFQVTPKTSHLHAVKRIFRKSTTGEAEYVAATSCCGKVLWIQNQMHHFIRDAYEKKLVQVLKIHTDDNVADLLTKAFDVSRQKVGTVKPKLNTARFVFSKKTRSLGKEHVSKQGRKKAKTGTDIEEGTNYVVNEESYTDKVKVINVEAEGISDVGETLNAATLTVSTVIIGSLIVSLDLSRLAITLNRLAITLNRLERSIQSGIHGFIEDFSKIARPLTKLLEKDTPFKFNDECHNALKLLKEKLTYAPVIVSPNWNLPFELMCDASDFAVRAILDKKGTKNVVVDHLSRIENDETSDDNEVDDYFPRETLMKIDTRDEPKGSNHLLLTGIGDEIYSTIDACKTANEIWIAIEMIQQGKSLNIQDVKTNLFWEFGKFTSYDGESMESYYSRFYKMMNEMIRNNLTVAMKPKKVKDSTYHKEKMLLCKQAEKSVPLQAEQADWLEDTDEQIDEQELESHYSFMAKMQEVLPPESN